MVGAPMPSERSEVAVAAVEGRIYVVGGFDGQTELEVYDPTADRWTRGAPFPRPLHHAAAAGLDGKLLVIGGYIDGWTASDTVYEYDPATDRWQTRASMPTPRGALAAAVIDGKIHAVGGVGRDRRNTGAHEVYRSCHQQLGGACAFADAAGPPGCGGVGPTAIRHRRSGRWPLF